MPKRTLQNRSGKVLTALFVIIAILLVTLTAICLYVLQKEVEKRKDMESKLEASRAAEIRLETQVGDLSRDKSLLEAKNKELDEKVNDLTGEVELEQGISKQLKSELSSIKDQSEKEAEKNRKLQDQLKRVADLEQENITFRSQFEEAKRIKEELENKSRKLEEKNQELTSKITDLEKTIQDYATRGVQAVRNIINPTPQNSQPHPKAVGLDKIVISNQIPKASALPEGQILTVDTETHFVILDIGARDGLLSGTALSVYREDKYLGDVRVTQLQDEMAAADFIPPLSSRMVRRDDRVVRK